MSEIKDSLQSKFDVNRKDFLQFCEVISTLAEDATIELSEDGAYKGKWGLSCITMDPTHVGLVNAYLGFTLNKSCYRNHEQLVQQFAVRIDELKKVVKTMKADSISIILDIKAEDKESNRHDYGTIELSSDEQSTELRMIEKEKDTTPMPAVKWDWKGSFDTKEFLAMLRAVENVSDYITFKAENDGVVYSGKGDAGKTKGKLQVGGTGVSAGSQNPDTTTTWTCSALEKELVGGTYSLEYLLPMLRVMKDGNVILRLGRKKPCSVTYRSRKGEQFGSSENAVNIIKSIEYYLAPRVE